MRFYTLQLCDVVPRRGAAFEFHVAGMATTLSTTFGGAECPALGSRGFAKGKDPQEIQSSAVSTGKPSMN